MVKSAVFVYTGKNQDLCFRSFLRKDPSMPPHMRQQVISSVWAEYRHAFAPVAFNNIFCNNHPTMPYANLLARGFRSDG